MPYIIKPVPFNIGHKVAAASVAPMDDSDLKAYWKFNETSGDILNSSVSGDSLGSSADLTVNGATYNQTDSPSGFGYSMLFDGVNDYCGVGSASIFNFMHNTSSLFTFIFWAKATTISSNMVWWDGGNSTCSNRIGSLIQEASNDRINFKIANGAGDPLVASDLTSNNYIPDNDWHMYAVMWDYSAGSNQYKITRDNNNLHQANKDSGTPTDSNSSGNPWLGGNMTYSASRYFTGYFTELSVWNRILTEDELTSLWNDGAGRAIY